MCFVDHQVALKAFFQFNQAWQVADVTVHGEESFGANQRPPVILPDLVQYLLQFMRVRVLEGETFCAGKKNALQDTVMAERVMEDQVVFVKKMTDGGDIGRMAAHKNHRILDPDMGGQPLFEIPVDLSLSGNEPAGRDGSAVAVERFLCSRNDLGMTGKPEVIVA